jgi:hypothetical protein
MAEEEVIKIKDFMNNAHQLRISCLMLKNDIDHLFEQWKLIEELKLHEMGLILYKAFHNLGNLEQYLLEILTNQFH